MRRISIDDGLEEAIPVQPPCLPPVKNQSPYGTPRGLVEAGSRHNFLILEPVVAGGMVMNRERDLSDFKRLLGKLQVEGKRYGEGDKLTELLGGEKLSFSTRTMVSEMVDILQDNPDFAKMVPEGVRPFFEGYIVDWRTGRVGASVSRTDRTDRTDRIAGKVAREILAGRKEYAIWGIPKGETSETLLLAMPQGKPIEDMATAKRLEKLLVEKYGARRTRIQEIDMEGELDWMRETGLKGSVRTATTPEENSLNGMTNEQARRNVNQMLSHYTKGLFSDRSWEGVDRIWKAMRAGQLDWTMTGSEYYNGSDGRPHGKIWKFEVSFLNAKNRPTTLHGTVTAAGAGSVEDPLDKYDLTAYVF